MAGDPLKTNDAKKTIFEEILQSKLPPEDKTQKRLAEEAQIVIGGGVETTAFTLCIATFHIINTPRISQRLHAVPQGLYHGSRASFLWIEREEP